MPRGGTWGYRGGLGVKFFFTEIQPDFVCELLTQMAHVLAQFLGFPTPGVLGRGQKFNFLNMVILAYQFKGDVQ